MPLRSDWSQDLCPVARALDVVGDPWVLLIVRNVLHGRGRFDTLRKSLGISEAVLSRRLQAMVDAGLLARADYVLDVPPPGPSVEHVVELLPVIQQLAVWSERHLPVPPRGAHMAMIHEACGSETTQGQVCSACGEVLVPEQMVWVKPWRNTSEELVEAGVLVDP